MTSVRTADRGWSSKEEKEMERELEKTLMEIEHLIKVRL